VLTLLFLVGILSVGYVSMDAAPVLSDEEYSYHGGTEWRTNFSEAQSIAASEDKPILVYFWATWCTYCEEYNEKVYPDPAVRSQLDDFVLVAVNVDNDAASAARLQQEYDVNYPPQHVAITPDGEVLLKMPGYASTDAFVANLQTAKGRSEQ
jgi:thiol:disulfide interchange protein